LIVDGGVTVLPPAIRRADWIVDVGAGAGINGGNVLYSGPPAGLQQIDVSEARRYLFPSAALSHPPRRAPKAWLKLAGITRNNLGSIDVQFPLGVFTTVTGVSGSGNVLLFTFYSR
jgi:excinuclease ABC subunit A